MQCISRFIVLTASFSVHLQRYTHKTRKQTKPNQTKANHGAGRTDAAGSSGGTDCRAERPGAQRDGTERHGASSDGRRRLRTPIAETFSEREEPTPRLGNELVGFRVLGNGGQLLSGHGVQRAERAGAGGGLAGALRGAGGRAGAALGRLGALGRLRVAPRLSRHGERRRDAPHRRPRFSTRAPRPGPPVPPPPGAARTRRATRAANGGAAPRGAAGTRSAEDAARGCGRRCGGSSAGRGGRSASPRRPRGRAASGPAPSRPRGAGAAAAPSPAPMRPRTSAPAAGPCSRRRLGPTSSVSWSGEWRRGGLGRRGPRSSRRLLSPAVSAPSASTRSGCSGGSGAFSARCTPTASAADRR